MAQKRMRVIAEEGDSLACEAIKIFREAGVPTDIVPVLPEIPADGYIVFTSRKCPGRFPGVHLRREENIVFLKKHPDKHDGFPGAVINMGRQLSVLPPHLREGNRKRRERSRKKGMFAF